MADDNFKVHDQELMRMVIYAEQSLRFFMKRDEMNAEVHMNTPIGFDGNMNETEYNVSGRTAKVRYSPIAYAASMLVTYLWQKLYKEVPRPIL